jgi:hypothetical protein
LPADLQAVAAARMHADPAILVLDADARRAVGGLLALVAESGADGGDRLRDRDNAHQLLGPQQQRHALSSILSLIVGPDH